MSDQSVTKHEPPSPPESETAAVLQMIERAARDPNVDINKLERLMALHDRIVASRARAAYFAALAAMQSKLPIIAEHGRLTIRERESKKILQVTPYAKWTDVNEAILPVLGEHGFSLSFRTGTAPDGKLTVTGILAHREGHSEETTLVLPYDQTGSKNAVQAIGSTTSYGKRYTAAALLNLTSRELADADTDGAAGADLPISKEQVEQLQNLIVQSGADIQRFLDYARKGDASVERLEDIKAHDFNRMLTALQAKLRSAS